MFSIPEQVTQAGKAVFETQLSGANALAQAAFDGGATLAEMNLNAFRDTLSALIEATAGWLAVRDGQQLASLSAERSQQLVERLQQQLRDYASAAAALAQESRARFVRIAETEGAASRDKVIDLLQAVKSAPATAAAPLNTFLKTAFAGAQEGYDRFAQAGNAAARTVDAGINRARQTVSEADAVVTE